MDPKLLLPVLALVFGLMATGSWWRHSRLPPAGRSWALLALIFAGVSLWLHARA